MNWSAQCIISFAHAGENNVWEINTFCFFDLTYSHLVLDDEMIGFKAMGVEKNIMCDQKSPGEGQTCTRNEWSPIWHKIITNRWHSLPTFQISNLFYIFWPICIHYFQTGFFLSFVTYLVVWQNIKRVLNDLRGYISCQAVTCVSYNSFTQVRMFRINLHMLTYAWL